MPITKPLVFVSSTSSCSEERRALRNGLPRMYELYLFEEDRARAEAPEQHCREMIERSDAFLCVLGPDYGSEFPGAEPSRSIVQWEFEMAEKLGHREILPFVRKLSPGERYDPRQQVFVDRVQQFRGGAWCKFYSTATDLVEGARSVLEQWLAEVWARAEQHRRALRRIVMPVLVAIAVIALALCVMEVSRSEVPRSTALAIALGTTIVVLLSACIAIWLMGGGHD